MLNFCKFERGFQRYGNEGNKLQHETIKVANFEIVMDMIKPIKRIKQIYRVYCFKSNKSAFSNLFSIDCPALRTEQNLLLETFQTYHRLFGQLQSQRDSTMFTHIRTC